MADKERLRNTTGYENFPAGVSAGPDAALEDFAVSPNPLLAGKRALITGGAIGVGRGIAFELAREGVEVGIHYFNEEDAAQKTKAAIEQGGGRAALLRADFSGGDNVQQLARHAKEALGTIDILVNNAGITANAPFLEVTPTFFDRLWNVNIRAMYFLTQSTAGWMKEQGGGTIINLCSLHSYFAANEHSVYALTKAAVGAFTRNVALELARYNIRVNAIAPGWCFGENHLAMLGAESRAADAARIPAGYISNPSTVGRLAVHLCLPDLDYFVGQTLVFDGGQSAIMPNTGGYDAPQTMRWGARYME